MAETWALGTTVYFTGAWSSRRTGGSLGMILRLRSFLGPNEVPWVPAVRPLLTWAVRAFYSWAGELQLSPVTRLGRKCLLVAGRESVCPVILL